MDGGSTGSTWADVARDLIAFARFDTATFLLILAAMVFALYLLGPKTMRTLRDRMREEIAERMKLPPPPTDPPGARRGHRGEKDTEEDRK